MKIPPNAEKVFSWILFEVYQWKQELFDGSFATFEMMHRDPAAVVIATTHDHTVLLLEEEHPGWKPFFSLPAGGAEWDESPIDIAKRELLEETGYSSDAWEEYAVHNPGGKTNHAVHLFIAKNCTETSERNLDPGEKSTLHFLTFDEFIVMATENQNFRHRDLSLDLCRMRLNGTIDSFRKDIFKY